ncbi:MAG: class I SAM-dependent RNA methyltransferase [Alphaproteobacteria bacterium]
MTELVIDRLGTQGDGIADTADGPFYIARTLPGERVEVEDDPDQPSRPQLKRILEPSDNRVAAPCKHYKRCGGCQLQHMSPALQEEFKTGIVTDALTREGFGAVALRPLITVPMHSRRRMSLRVMRSGKQIIIGLNAARSDQVVDLAVCEIAEPMIVNALPAWRELFQTLFGRRGHAALVLTVTVNGLDAAMVMNREASLEDRERLTKFAYDYGIARISWNDEVITAPHDAHQQFGPALIAPPSGGFLQAAKTGEEALVTAVLEAVGDASVVADMFCGAGTFTMPMAKNSHVTAFESDEEAVRALQVGADRAAGIGKCNPVKAQRRDLFRRPLLPTEVKTFDAIVFDPPRAGAKAQVEELAQTAVPRLVGVSCNPVSFARDAAILRSGGYHLDWVQPVDQFRHSAHVELVGQFTK